MCSLGGLQHRSSRGFAAPRPVGSPAPRGSTSPKWPGSSNRRADVALALVFTPGRFSVDRGRRLWQEHNGRQWHRCSQRSWVPPHSSSHDAALFPPPCCRLLFPPEGRLSALWRALGDASAMAAEAARRSGGCGEAVPPHFSSGSPLSAVSGAAPRGALQEWGAPPAGPAAQCGAAGRPAAREEPLANLEGALPRGSTPWGVARGPDWPAALPALLGRYLMMLARLCGV